VTHSWTVSNKSLNQLSFQFGRRKFDEPNNSQSVGEYFSSGTTLQTGANIVGDQNDTGTVFEFATRSSRGSAAASGRRI